MSSWLDLVVSQHVESEAPSSFWRWSALCAISAVLKDKVWIDRHYYKLYPNIYVMLFAHSGLKKGPPVNMARVLVENVNNTRVINGRASIQGILKKLGTAETKPGGYIINSSCGFICSSEMASSMVEDKAAMTILTDLYDRNYRSGNWESLLKMESFILKDPTVTLLGATNEAHSNEFFTKQDINGGFFARTFFIHESHAQTRNSLMYAPAVIPNYKELSCYLKELANLSGEITVTEDAKKYMNDWYLKFWKDIEIQNFNDPTGTVNRFQDSVLKVAILTSLGRTPNMTLGQEAIEESIGHCEKLIGNIRRATLGTGSGTFGGQKKIAIMELVERDNHSVSRAQLHKKFWMHASLAEWTEIMAQLQIAGISNIETIGNQIIYTMTDKQVLDWTNHFAGR
jgi:hypothetical protein